MADLKLRTQFNTYFCKSIRKETLNDMKSTEKVTEQKLYSYLMSIVHATCYIIVKKVENKTGNMNFFVDFSHNKPAFYIYIFSYITQS